MNRPLEQLMDDLNTRIDYWRKEADLTYSEAIGALECVKAGLVQEMLDADEANEGEK